MFTTSTTVCLLSCYIAHLLKRWLFKSVCDCCQANDCWACQSRQLSFYVYVYDNRYTTSVYQYFSVQDFTNHLCTSLCMYLALGSQLFWLVLIYTFMVSEDMVQYSMQQEGPHRNLFLSTKHLFVHPPSRAALYKEGEKWRSDRREPQCRILLPLKHS